MKLQIEKLVFGGQGIAHANEQTFFVWNALAGEEVEIEIVKKRKGIREAVATQILTPSPDRVAPQETHFLSCSPWQIISPARELEWKVNMAKEVYEHIGKLQLTELPIVSIPNADYGYRNKMEFSFWETDDGIMHLSLFERGKKIRTPLEGCALAEPIINTVAQQVLDWVREQKFGRRDLKTLIVRSNGAGKAIAALFLKERHTFSTTPILSDTFLGFHIYYSDYRSPASVPTELLFSEGKNELTAQLLNTQLSFGLLGFFQVNIPIFELALKRMQEFLPADSHIVDFYSGGGAISIPLAHAVQSAVLVDSNEEAIEFAKQNIQANHLTNYTAHCSPAEKIAELITTDKIIILDPPRAGLHQDVVNRILETQPQRLIYLSCNVSTQARDIALLSEHYTVTSLELYNFFPRTPHVEALAILEKM